MNKLVKGIGYENKVVGLRSLDVVGTVTYREHSDPEGCGGWILVKGDEVFDLEAFIEACDGHEVELSIKLSEPIDMKQIKGITD